LGAVVQPLVLYVLCVLGGVGVCLALPRGGKRPQVLGALFAALVGGAAMVALGLKAGQDRPNFFFYLFALIGVGAALRVITHPRPVYAALYFILTVLASAGLFVLLSAEFMAFALIIVYAGAILITYLFVIMLATQAPEEGQEENLAQYDTHAREPLAATVVGFMLLAVLTAMMFSGMKDLPRPERLPGDPVLGRMHAKVERVLREEGLIEEGDEVAGIVDTSGEILVIRTDGTSLRIPREKWPKSLAAGNIESVGFNLLYEHPGGIEIAGVILLMAMLGAVVLSRKQVQAEEEAKQAQARRLGLLPDEGGAP
jgi:NADH-quinone oxidoreductase subunit J